MKILIFLFFGLLLLHFFAQTFLGTAQFQQIAQLGQAPFLLIALICWLLIGFVFQFDLPNFSQNLSVFQIQNIAFSAISLALIGALYVIGKTGFASPALCFGLLVVELLFFLGKLFFLKEPYIYTAPIIESPGTFSLARLIPAYDFIGLVLRLSLLNLFAFDRFETSQFLAILVAALAIVLFRFSY